MVLLRIPLEISPGIIFLRDSFKGSSRDFCGDAIRNSLRDFSGDFCINFSRYSFRNYLDDRFSDFCWDYFSGSFIALSKNSPKILSGIPVGYWKDLFFRFFQVFLPDFLSISFRNSAENTSGISPGIRLGNYSGITRTRTFHEFLPKLFYRILKSIIPAILSLIIYRFPLRIPPKIPSGFLLMILSAISIIFLGHSQRDSFRHFFSSSSK